MRWWPRCCGSSSDDPPTCQMSRLLVVLPNWYGETLFATPFLRALREHQRGAAIATLGWPQCREMLAHSPLVDEILDYDEQGAHRGPLGQARLAQALRQRRFDVAFVLRRSLSRSLLLALAGIPVRVGAANRKSGWLLTHPVQVPTAPQHKAWTYLPLLQALGVNAPSAGSYEYTVAEEERREARGWLEGQGLLDGQPIVVLHPGANWPHKRWAPQRFAQLADRLAEALRAHLVLSGGPADVPLVEQVHLDMRASATVSSSRTGLRQVAARMEQAHLVVSNDTGVMHVAAAMRRPVVALYGPTSPLLTGPLGDPARTVVLHHPDCCPQVPCFQPDRPPHPGMEAITVDEVYEAARKLLSAECGIRNAG
ncbi:MAG: lipopolysaccharide heptosyltransferase II [Candidatus Omnitrophica bacterium]|nr:lipopolysaccharide heptosyltransferase II [Candidatus Omnitrophota bacterium]